MHRFVQCTTLGGARLSVTYASIGTVQGNTLMICQHPLIYKALPIAMSVLQYFNLSSRNKPTILLSLLIIAMRGRRDVSISSVFVRLSMAILHRLFLPPQGDWVMLPAKSVYKRLANDAIY